MKTKPIILAAAISALLVSGVSAQQENPAPAAPPTPQSNAPTPPPPAPATPNVAPAPNPGAPQQRREGDGPGFPAARRDGGPGRPAGAGELERRRGENGGPRDGNFHPGQGREGERRGPEGGDGLRIEVREGDGRGPREGGPREGGPREGGPRGPGQHEEMTRGFGGGRDGHDGGGKGGHDGDGGGRFGGLHDGGGHERKETRPFLGVVSAPLPPALSAQLGLPEGFGLVVQDVAPDSPAAKAGLQKYDVIKLLNDQQIVDQHQLATLVTSLGVGKEVSLTVLRKGQEQKLTATLVEHTFSMREGGEGGVFVLGGGNGNAGNLPNLSNLAKEWQERAQKNPERAAEIQERMREVQKRIREGLEKREGEHQPAGGPKRDGEGRPGEGPKTGAAVNPERLLQEAKPSGGAQIQVQTSVGTTTIDGAQAHLRLKDASGEIEVNSENGKRVLTARDPDGKVTFTGPVNTDEERNAVPEPIRKRLSEVRIRQNGNQAQVEVGTRPRGEQDFQ